MGGGRGVFRGERAYSIVPISKHLVSTFCMQAGVWGHNCDQADLALAHVALVIWGLRQDGKGQY